MRELRIKAVRAVAMGCLALPLLPGAAAAKSSSLPKKEGTGPRPGPEALYQAPAKSPQLENAPHGPWHAKPILISGASAYRKGEFVYQGNIYDDHGAKEVTDPKNP